MRENCTYSLSGGRWPARKRATSDPTPEKSPNNAGQPAAEGVEGRGLAKGNPPQQNASQTPSRNDAPSALERIRQTAKKDKKLRFTALLHHIYSLDTLRSAYLSLKRDASVRRQLFLRIDDNYFSRSTTITL
jgi:RNA-directed DNA polymerase